MSKTVDERVVSMQFDNKNFESNVSTTMSTLDKLKQKLNLTGASKGLETVNSAAKNVNMSGLSSSIETVRTKFSALEVMGVTALANITNSAVNAGKKMLSALTVEPVKTGFNEYELKMDSMKTIMASTGESAKKVNSYLDELNKYSDQTIYSFSDMTQNIGKFTNAGVKLEDAVMAIKGVSNEAAVSGANANEASRAMYNFAQALSAGHVKLIDWKSIENANMATKEFKEQLIKSAVASGTLTKTSDGMYKTLAGNTLTATKNFNDTLKDEWMTTEVLVGTLKDYADNTTAIGKKAFSAAQDVTKFTQMVDVLKETAQSGWAKTWELIFGDVNQAKAIFTPLTNFLSKIIDKTSDFRNNLLEGALSSPLGQLSKKLSGLSSATKKLSGISKATETASDKMKNYDDVVNKVIRGDFGNMEPRWKALTKAGYDWAHVQNLVNEKLGYSKRYATDYNKQTDKLTDSQSKFIKSLSDGYVKLKDWKKIEISGKATKEFKEQLIKSAVAAGTLTKTSDGMYKTLSGRTLTATKNFNDSLEDGWMTSKVFSSALKDNNSQVKSLTNAQLKKIGLTKEEIKEYRSLEEQSKKTGKSIDELIKGTEQKSGRTLLIESFKNAGQGLVAVISSIKNAWTDVFPPMTSTQLYNIIKGLNEFSQKLKVSDETADKLKRTFKGVFAIFDMVLTIIGGPIKIAFKILTQLLGSFDINILDVTASIGDAIVKFRDWLDSTLDFTKVFEKIAPALKNAVKSFREWVKGIKTADNIPLYIITGLVNGLKAGAIAVWNAVINLGKGIIEKIKSVLGIHSPSTEFFEVGKNIIAGLVNGLQNGVSAVWDFMKNLGQKCIEFIKNIDFGSVFAVGLSIGLVASVKKLTDVLEIFSAPLAGLGNMLSGIGSFFVDLGQGLEKNLKAKALESKSKALLNMAKAIGILAASVFILSKIDSDKLWGAIGALAALSAIVIVLSFAAKKVGGTDGEFGKLSLSLIAISFSLLIMASAIKKLEFLNKDNMGPVLLGLAAIVGGLSAILFVFGKFVKGKSAQNIDKAGTTLLKMSVALLLMAMVIKIISKLKIGDIIKGIVTISAFGGIIAGLIAITELAGKKVDQIGSMLLKMSAAMLVLTLVIKMIAKMDYNDIAKGIYVIVAFGGIFTGLIAATKLAGNDLGKIGSTLLAMSASIMLLTLVVKMISGISVGNIRKGIITIAAFGGIIAGLIAITELAGKDQAKIATTLLAMSVSIGILAAVAVVLSLISLEGLAKGIVAVGMLGAIMALMIAATRGASDCKGNIIAMTVAIGIMAVAVAALSFIDTEKLVAATGSLSLLMGMFALLIKVSDSAKSSIGSLIAISLVVVGLSGIIYLLSSLPVESVIAVSASLSTLLLSLSASMFIINKSGSISISALASIGIMTLVVGALGGILYLLQGLDVSSTMETAMSLSTLLLSLSVACLITSHIPSAGAIDGAIGLAAFIGIMAGVLAVLGGLSKIPGFNELISDGGKTLSLIGYALGSFVGSIIGGVGAGISSGLPEIGANLSAFMNNVKPFIEGAKMIDPSSLEGVKSLVGVILALTAANVIEGLTSWFTGGSSLTKFGEEISVFGGYIKSYADSVTGIDCSAVESSAKAAKSLAQMADIIPNKGGLLAWFTGDNSIDSFANNLPLLGDGLLAFSNSVEGINVENIMSASKAAKSLAQMADIIPNEGGLLAWLTGDNSIASFAGQLEDLGEGLSKFSTSVEGINAENITAASKAAKSLAQMADTIPNEGGIVAWLTGDNSIASFAGQLEDLGKGLLKFSNSVKGINAENVIAASKAAKNLATMADTIPNEGGMAAWFAGDNSVASFAGQFEDLGDGLSKFSKSVKNIKVEQVKAASKAAKAIADMVSVIPSEGGIKAWFTGETSISNFVNDLPTLGTGLSGFATKLGDNFNVNNVKSAANAAKTIADMVSIIPNEGGIKAWFTGEASMVNFAKELPNLGLGLAQFSSNLGENFNANNITAAANSAKTLAQMADTAPEDTSKLASFGKNLVTFGEKLKGFFDKISGVTEESLSNASKAINKIKKISDNLSSSSIKQASDSIDSIVKAVNNLSKVKETAADGFANALKTIANNNVKSIIKAFNDAGPKLENAGINAIKQVIKGAKSQDKSAKSTFSNIISNCLKSIKSQDNYDKFKESGKYLGEGLVEGIKAKYDAAYDAGFKLGQKAAEGEKKGQKSSSPSKLTIQAGKWLGEGLIIGINKMNSKVYNSGYNLGETATNTISSAISRISDAVNSDIDAQPTIRPVLDLSDVKSGANSIGGMLSGKRTLSVDTENVGAISVSMSRIQNGSDSGEVVSAIKSLRKDISKLPRNSYTINGITYDDGSNVSNAVETLVRAARIERRK